MDIKICAYSLQSGNGITLTEFFTSLAAKGIHSVDDALLAVIIDGHTACGILLSPRDAKSFCTLTQNGAQIQIRAEDLAAGKIVADFNFFIFDLHRGFGLYQSYYRSAPLQEFLSYLRTAWRTTKKEREYAAGVRPENAMTAASVAVRRSMGGIVSGAVVYRAHTFQQKVDMLASVNRLTFSVKGGQPVGGILAPFGAALKGASYSVSFVQQANWQQVKTQIKAITGTANTKSACVLGRDGDGNETIYRLLHDVDVVEVLDFDTLTQGLNIDSNNIVATLSSSAIMVALRNLRIRADIELLFNTGQR